MAKYMKMDLADVKIRQEFLDHPPKEEKVLARKAAYQSEGKLRRPMSVTSEGVLIDGYASFLALQALGKKSDTFKVRDVMAVVDARHPSSPEKQYHWRTNHGNKIKFEPGDHIAVRTRCGVREAVVDAVRIVPAEEALGLDIVIGRWNPDHKNNQK